MYPANVDAEKNPLVLAVTVQEGSWIALKLIAVVKSMILFQHTSILCSTEFIKLYF